MLLSLWIACFLLGCCQAQEQNILNLDGTPRYTVTRSACTCAKCNTTTTAYTRKFGSSDFDNVAYGKPVTSSTEEATYYTCGLTNGIIDAAYNICPICLKTAHYDALPWAEVDLLSVYTVERIYVSRFYPSWRDQGRKGQELFKGMDVLVDGHVVQQFATYSASHHAIPRDIDINIFLNHQRSFRYIRMEKRDEPSRPDYRVLQVCDVKVWVCRPGYYSAGTTESCKPCPTSCNYYCNHFNGCLLMKYNVAIKKYAKHHGTRGLPYKVVDGIRPTGSPEVNCISLDAGAGMAWWRVYLGDTYKVYDIEVTPRVDCCGADALKDFTLWVTMGSGMPSGTEGLFHRYTGDINTKVLIKVTKPPVIGYYVWVTRMKTLSFCELEAYGFRYLYLIPGTKCWLESVYSSCDSNGVCQNGMCKAILLRSCNRDSDCADSNICDANKCRLDYLKPCVRFKDTCVLGAFCDVDSICKVRNGYKCRVPAASCARDSICDAFKRCGIKPDHYCESTDECVAGALCVEGRCKCSEHITNFNKDRCDPVQGRVTTQCSSTSECNYGECRNRVCTCVDPLTPSPTDFTCRRKVTSACSSQSDCSSGLVCLNSKCYLKAGQNCFGNEQNCVAGTVCVDDTCSYLPGQKCTDMGELCIADSTCSSGICLLLLGKSCVKFPKHCLDGLCSAQDGNTCRIKTGQKCTLETGQLCHAGSFCEDTVCKQKLGEVCTESAECLKDAICSQVQGSANKECRFDFGSSCQEDGDCIAGSVCDIQRSCRIPNGGSCIDHPDMCVHGSHCTPEKQCLCNTNLTNPATSKCEPNAGQVGGSCLPIEEKQALPCVALGARCKNITCECVEGFVPNPITLECHFAPGSVCSGGDRIPCAVDSVCDNNKCALDVGKSCKGEKSAYCMIGTVCDTDNICRLDFNQGCEGNHENLCRTGTACDLVHICRKPLREHCRKTEDCVAGTYCNQGLCECTKDITAHIGDKCVPVAGLVFSKCEIDKDCTVDSASCNPESKLCVCDKGYLVHPGNLTCAKGFEMECSTDDECVPGMICDPVLIQCRIEHGYMCDEGKEEFCISGTVCDFDHICRLELKSNCTGERSDYCKSGTFCDIVKQCGIGIGGYCNETGLEDTCVAGAKCVENLCTCDTDLSTVFGAICEPITGRYGGSCTGSGNCEVINSECVDGICKCKPPYSPDRFFGCGPVLLGKSKSQVLFFAILLGILLLILATLLCIAIRRFRQRDKARKKLMEHRGQSLMQLTELRADVEQGFTQQGLQSMEPSMEPSTEPSMDPSTFDESSAVSESTVQSLASTTGIEESTTVVE